MYAKENEQSKIMLLTIQKVLESTEKFRKDARKNSTASDQQTVVLKSDTKRNRSKSDSGVYKTPPSQPEYNRSASDDTSIQTGDESLGSTTDTSLPSTSKSKSPVDSKKKLDTSVHVIHAADSERPQSEQTTHTQTSVKVSKRTNSSRPYSEDGSRTKQNQTESKENPPESKPAW